MSMMNFEKIDDYLANRLPSEEKAAFEQELNGDPALKEEVTFQQEVIEGVRQARMLEIKQMLNQVPVPSSGWSSGQIAATVISVGVVATSLYFYFQNDEPTLSPDQNPPAVISQPDPSTTAPAAVNEQEETSPAKEEPKSSNTATKPKTVSPVQKPDIQVVDPSDEFKETEEPAETTTHAKSELSLSKMEVTTISANKKYSFNYQFAEGKLLLYGPFDKSLYEILEINGGNHAVFLFYKENYYLLDESQKAITPLEPIRDGSLLQKLKEYRGR